MSDETKGLWPAFIDGLVRALSGALIAVVTSMAKDNYELKAELERFKNVLAKQREVARRQRDAVELKRVRDKYKD